MKKILSLGKKHLTPHKFKLFIIFLFSTISALVGSIVPKLNGLFIDLLISSKSNLATIKKLLSIIIIIIIIKYLFDYISSKEQMKLVSLSTHNLSKNLIFNIQNTSLLNSENIDSTYLSDRIINDSNNIISYSIDIILSTLTQIIIMIISIYILYNILGKIILFFLVLLIIYVFIYMLLRELIFEINYRFNENSSLYFKDLNMQIKDIEFLKIHSLTDYMLNLFKESFENLYSLGIKRFNISYAYSTLNRIISLISTIFIYIYGGKLVIGKSMTIGEFTILTTYFNYLLTTIDYFFNLTKLTEETKASYVRIEEILETPKELRGDIELGQLDNISLENLSFSYKDEDYLIDKFNYFFEKGKIYLIKGSNGSGKTTLIKLIVGLYLNDYIGSIKYNGISIKKLNMEELMKRNIGVVSQRYPKDLILKLQDKYKNMDKFIYNLSSNKENFSGGELQKLLNSIVLGKETDLLILDEPTSAIDKETRDSFIKYMEKLKKDKILIIISHDNLFLSLADEIIDMDCIL